MQRISKYVGADGKQSGLYTKFMDYKKKWQDRQDGQPSTREIASSDDDSMSLFSASEETDVVSMSPRGDGGESGGTTTGGKTSYESGGFADHKVYTYSAKTVTKEVDAFCGVPVYKSGNDLKYG